MSTNHCTRRDILKAAAAGLALPVLLPGHVLGLDSATTPGESVKIGLIGCGGRASGLVPEGLAVKGFRVVAVCDCEPRKAGQFAAHVGGSRNWAAYDDFRQMIDKEKLDAVMVETTTHARAWIAVLAMQAGVDAYIEKPMCLTISEGRAMVNAARKLKRVTQVGTQQRSMPLNNWASDLVKNGAIGKVLTVLAPNFVGPFRWTKTSTKDVKSPVRSLVGPLDQPGRAAALRRQPAPRLGPLVGLRRRRPLLRRHRLGHPLLRPDQPRPGHRRHRTGRSAPGGAGRRARDGQVRPPVGGRRGPRRNGRHRHRHRLPRDGQDHRPSGPRHHEVRQRHRACAAPRRRPRPRPGRDLHRPAGQDRDQPRQGRQQPQGGSSARPAIRATTAAANRPTTWKTGSSASRAAGAATPTSRSASGPRPSATWSISSATWAASVSP